MQPVIDHLYRYTSKAEYLLLKSGLSPDTFQQKGSYIPLHSMMSLLNRAERTSGDRLYAWNCVMDASSSSAAGLFESYFGRKPTAYEALVKFTKMLNLKSSGGKYWCEVTNDKISLLRTTESRSPVDNWKSEQFVLAAYIKMLSHVLGRHVAPTTVTLRAPTVPTTLPEMLQGCQITPGHRNTGVSVSISNLYTHKNLIMSFPNSMDAPDPNMSKVKNQLQNMILPVNGDTFPSLASMSEAFGLSRRSLQRRLSEYGLSFSEIHDELRFRRCLEALADPSLSITSIAYEVGYKNSGDFSRAFSRKMGFSPREYRKQLLGEPSK